MLSRIISIIVALGVVVAFSFLEIRSLEMAVATHVPGIAFLSGEKTVEYMSSSQGANGADQAWLSVMEDSNIEDAIAVRTGEGAKGVFQLENILLVLDQNTTLNLKQVEDSVIAELVGGRIFVDSLADTRRMLIYTDKAVFAFENGSGTLSRTSEASFAEAGTGGIVVSFLSRELEPVQLNGFFVAPGKVAQLDNKKVDDNFDRITTLYASRLEDEFVSQAPSAGKWLMFAQKIAAGWHGERSSEFLTSLRGKKSTIMVTGFMRSVGQTLNQSLVFDPKKKVDVAYDYFVRDVDHWLSLVVRSEKEAAEEFIPKINISAEISDEAFEFLLSRLVEIAHVDVSHNLAHEGRLQLLEQLSKVMTIGGIDMPNYELRALAAARSLLVAAESVASAKRAFALAETGELLAYYKDIITAVSRNIPENDKSMAARMLLAHRSLLLDIVNMDASLFNEDTMTLLALIERRHLDNLDDASKAEAEKAFIEEKLTLLKGLKQMTFDEVRPVTEARFTARRLLNDIEALRSGTLDSYFEKELKELAEFLVFLESPYAQLHGSFDERYKAYIQRQAENSELRGLVEGGSGRRRPGIKEKDQSTEEILKEDFAVAKIEKFIFEEMEEEGDLVEIKEALIEGIVFAGTYDIERKAFTKLVLFGNEINQTIPIDRLNLFVLIRAGKLRPQDGSFQDDGNGKDEENEKITRLLKGILQEKLADHNISAKTDNMRLIDVDNRLFEVTDARVVDEESLRVKFDFYIMTEESRAFNVVIQTSGEPMQVNGSFTLSELASRVTALYKQFLLQNSN